MSRTPRLVVLAAGLLAAGCSGLFESPTEPTPAPNPDEIGYTALGASDGIGYGSSVVCAPLDTGCENGKGYVQEIRRRLMATGKTVTYLNLSIPGFVLSPAIQTLASDIGREVPGNILDREAPFVPPTTTVVTVFAGGNDANVLAQAALAGRGGADLKGYLDERIRQWGNDYGSLLTRVRARAPSARFVLLNLPNMAAAPYVDGNTQSERSILQYITVGLADRVNALAGANVAVVDLLCTASLYDRANFSSDGFHPSDSGYQLMADLTFPVVAGTGGTSPQPTCAARSFFPPAF
ncbi:MAG: SGNH/GDSL hydrolase family protein [Vicinamibacterales bacterium]